MLVFTLLFSGSPAGGIDSSSIAVRCFDKNIFNSHSEAQHFRLSFSITIFFEGFEFTWCKRMNDMESKNKNKNWIFSWRPSQLRRIWSLDQLCSTKTPSYYKQRVGKLFLFVCSKIISFCLFRKVYYRQDLREVWCFFLFVENRSATCLLWWKRSYQALLLCLQYILNLRLYKLVRTRSWRKLCGHFMLCWQQCS